MATVCKRLGLLSPSFLTIKPRRNLYELLSSNTKGCRVTTTQWVGRDFADCFYTLDAVSVAQDLKSGSASGKLTWFGKERDEVVDIKDSTKRIWMIYNDDKENIALSRKVSGGVSKE